MQDQELPTPDPRGQDAAESDCIWCPYQVPTARAPSHPASCCARTAITHRREQVPAAGTGWVTCIGCPRPPAVPAHRAASVRVHGRDARRTRGGIVALVAVS